MLTPFLYLTRLRKKYFALKLQWEHETHNIADARTIRSRFLRAIGRGEHKQYSARRSSYFLMGQA